MVTANTGVAYARFVFTPTGGGVRQGENNPLNSKGALTKTTFHQLLYYIRITKHVLYINAHNIYYIYNEY